MRGIIQSVFFATQNSRCGTASAPRSSASSAWARLKRKSSLSGWRATRAANRAERGAGSLAVIDGDEHAGDVVRTAATVGRIDDLLHARRRIIGGAENLAQLGLGNDAADAIAAKKDAFPDRERPDDEIDLRRLGL